MHRLLFPALDFSIDANEVKHVSDNVCEVLLCNCNIKEVIIIEPTITVEHKVEKSKNKRKK